MPRININEKDNTSPGTPGGYSNNTVLIAGFSAYTDEYIKENGTVLADDNGIFEFTSAGDFVKTIGLVAPTIYPIGGGATPVNSIDAELPEHYGNQMAYELLNMGYPIIYINLGMPYDVSDDGTPKDPATTMQKLGDFDGTWKIFMDKASYDFRFISHGLLTSTGIAKSEALVKLEARIAKMKELMQEFEAEQAPLKDAVIVTDPENDNEIVYVTDSDGEEILDDNGDPIPLMRHETYEEANARVFEKIKSSEAYYVINTKSNAAAIDYTETFLTNAGTYELALKFIEAEEATVAAELNGAEDAFKASDFDAANAAIAKLAHYKAIKDSYGNEDEIAPGSGRGDCIALIEVDEAKYITKVSDKKPENLIVDAINTMSSITADNGKYCACTVPSVVYTDNRKFPGAFHYLACFKNSLGLGFAEWYAAAGYTRGVSSYTIDFTTVKLGEVAIQALEPRNLVDDPQKAQPKFAVNVIANFRGSYYLWGNRTCHPLGSAAGVTNDLVASHFLNIRQLCTTIKKQLYISCRRFTFDPNSDVLWINFKNSITPMLDRMKADQGIREYKIEKVYTDKKATLKAKIRIVPIEAVEDFTLEVSLEDSLGSGETTVTVTE